MVNTEEVNPASKEESDSPSTGIAGGVRVEILSPDGSPVGGKVVEGSAARYTEGEYSERSKA